MADKAGIARLIERRDQFLLQLEALRNKVEGFELAIALLMDASSDLEAEGPGPIVSASKRTVMDTVLLLLREAGADGINAPTVVARATRIGITLNQASISSLLSRLKREGIVIYEDMRYKLKEYSKSAVRPEETPGTASNAEATAIGSSH